MTKREVIDFIRAQVSPMLQTEIVGETLVIDTSTQRFYVRIEEDMGWRPSRSA